MNIKKDWPIIDLQWQEASSARMAEWPGMFLID